MNIKDIYRPIIKDLKNVERRIDATLQGSQHPAIRDINRFLMQSPGKRLRPALTLLAYHAVNQRSGELEKLLSSSAAIEILHIASLVHDDVIDNAAFRHKQASIHAKWGKDISILLGDFLYSAACSMVADCENTRLFKCISGAAKELCEGELMQVCDRGNLDIQETKYLTMIEKKTAKLFAYACQAGAVVAGAEDRILESLEKFGLNFGMAFQIIDDYLDIVSSEEKLGKMPCQDIISGELTLPWIYLFKSLKPDRKDEIKKLLVSADEETVDLLRMEMNKSDVAIQTERIIYSYIEKARNQLDVLNDSVYRESLVTLLDFANGRIKEYSSAGMEQK